MAPIPVQNSPLHAPSEPVFQVHAVTFLRQQKQVLNGVSLTVPFGAHIALVGPNGSGKTSLLQLMAGRLRPSQGRVTVGGQDLATLPSLQRARQLAVVHQHEQVHGQLRVRDYVALGRTPHIEASKAQNAHAVCTALARCHLDSFQDRLLRTLSGGEQQRAAIARALAQEPRVLLLDEPTNHLDLRTRADVLDLLAELDMTVIAALHELSLVHRFADQAVLLSDGQLVAEGVPAQVLTPELVLGHFGMDVFYLPLPHHDRHVAVFESPRQAQAPAVNVIPLEKERAL